MNNILQALLLTFSIVFIIDFSGIVDSFKRFIWKLFNKIPYQYYRLKPIDCSLCMTFWLIGLNQYINNVEILQVIFTASLFSYLSIYIIKIMKYVEKNFNDRLTKY